MTLKLETAEQLEALLTWLRASVLTILEYLESNGIFPRGTRDSQEELLNKLLSGEIDYKTVGNEDQEQ